MVTYFLGRFKKTALTSINQKLKENWRPASVSLCHWDGKLMDTLDGSSSEERVPVLLSGIGGTKLLGVPTLPQDLRMGRGTARVTVELLVEWDAEDTVAGMVFDTTSVNSGSYSSCHTKSLGSRIPMNDKISAFYKINPMISIILR